MRLQLPALRPLIRLVMMIDIAKEEAVRRPMNDQSDILTDTHRRKIRISRSVQFVELQAGMYGIELEIKGGGLYRLLFLSR